MDIAIIIKRFVTTGGAERFAVEVARQLEGRGHRLTVYAREADPGLLGAAGFRPVAQRLSFSSVANSWAFARDVAPLVAAGGHDLVWTHERGYLQDVATVHTFSYRRSTHAVGPVKRLADWYASPRSWLHLHLEARQMCSFWLAPVSAVIAEDLTRFYGRRHRMTVITPGVDVSGFDAAGAAQRPHGGDAPGNGERRGLSVLFIGTEFRRKGLDLLLPAIGREMRLTVVGKGERWRWFRRRVHRLGIGDRVHFAGLAADVRPFLHDADVLVLPSRAEAFGMSLLEAMAGGLPVVASPSCGAAALIRHGVNGFLAADTREIRAALDLLRDPGRRRQVGAAARQTAQSHTWRHTADAYEALFERVVAAKRR